MDDQRIRDIADDAYDESREDSLRSMIGDFYNKRMISSIALVWIYAVVFLALACFTAVKFFDAEQTRHQIMYAAIFVSCVQFIALIKIFAWQMIHRNSIKREIKKLDLAVMELAQAVKKQ